jgi:hypothetical protein
MNLAVYECTTAIGLGEEDIGYRDELGPTGQMVAPGDVVDLFNSVRRLRCRRRRRPRRGVYSISSNLPASEVFNVSVSAEIPAGLVYILESLNVSGAESDPEVSTTGPTPSLSPSRSGR